MLEDDEEDGSKERSVQLQRVKRVELEMTSIEAANALLAQSHLTLRDAEGLHKFHTGYGAQQSHRRDEQVVVDIGLDAL